ncbi:MAG: hypothetical protein AAB955_01850 [Patescibacteria group bacterium]|mgnify:CR=1 FL=1
MTSLFLAQLFGLYFIIVSVIVFLRGKSMMPAIKELLANRGSVMLFALIELIAGLALVITHPVMSFDWMGIISLIGWMIFVEGIIYLLLPSQQIQKLVKWFNRPQWFQAGAVISLVAGVYLAAIGFGLW